MAMYTVTRHGYMHLYTPYLSTSVRYTLCLYTSYILYIIRYFHNHESDAEFFVTNLT